MERREAESERYVKKHNAVFQRSFDMVSFQESRSIMCVGFMMLQWEQPTQPVQQMPLIARLIHFFQSRKSLLVSLHIFLSHI